MDIVLDVAFGQEETLDVVPGEGFALAVVEADGHAEYVFLDFGFAFAALSAVAWGDLGLQEVGGGGGGLWVLHWGEEYIIDNNRRGNGVIIRLQMRVKN